jgi:hypothetical protein
LLAPHMVWMRNEHGERPVDVARRTQPLNRQLAFLLSPRNFRKELRGLSEEQVSALEKNWHHLIMHNTHVS